MTLVKGKSARKRNEKKIIINIFTFLLLLFCEVLDMKHAKFKFEAKKKLKLGKI